MTTGYIFLGGPADGDWRAVMSSHPAITIREYKPVETAGLGAAKTISVLDHVYTRRDMTGGHCVYAHTSIPTHEILPHLLRGYRSDAL
ncbi:hypothetical protein [Polynucleobacter sp. UK-Kesae-W10]|uniref:hypothetical protein n=1 Tax=Polynucleobacter sp. UK-Kesae-W10 TaxID=1819738 RepID=UPI001C0D2ADB|nr:hypothetical protein [Polynucleobacter sp. UK-Kesae-W10]MBU3577528.1 hypothetical protein [Polynucleobacter sp. UK-Kesae-W10]